MIDNVAWHAAETNTCITQEQVNDETLGIKFQPLPVQLLLSFEPLRCEISKHPTSEPEARSWQRDKNGGVAHREKV